MIGRQRGRRLAMVALAVIITYTCSRAAALLSYPEFALLDAWMRLRPPRVPAPEIVLVAVEEQDARAFEHAKPRGCTCKGISRADTAELVRRIKQAGACVVGIDLIFEDPCPVGHHDEQLFAALRAPGDTVIVTGTNPVPGRFIFKQMRALVKLAECSPNAMMASPVLYCPRGLIRSVQLIQREDLTEEEVRQGGRTEGTAYPPFALACYAAYRGHRDEIPEELSNDRVRCADVDIPVWYSETVHLMQPVQSEDAPCQNKYIMLINWAGRAGTFPTYSMRTITRATQAQRRRLLQGKIVLIGAMSDTQSTPMWRSPARDTLAPRIGSRTIDQRLAESLTGLEVHANILSTVLQRQFLREPQYGAMWVYLLALSLLTLFIFRRIGGWRALASTCALVAGAFIVSSYLMRSDFWLLSVTPAVGVALSAIAGAILAFGAAHEHAGELERSLQAFSNVMSTVAHDLKQPLSAISALAQVQSKQLRDGKLTPEFVELIQKQVHEALGDIDELLMVDPQRAVYLSRKRFDLADLARNLAFTQSMKTGIHQIEVQAPEEGLWVNADPRYLGRALSNLMDNATKYWPQGGTVVVEMKREPGQITARVIDHGMGIAREAQQRLFNPFQRAVPVGLDIPGTGVGLYSVRRIMEAHGGSVDLISAPGEGSIFILVLPDEPEVGEAHERLSHTC